MIAQSNTIPVKFKVDKRGELADISFFDNVTQEENEDGTFFEYQHYLLTVDFRKNLEEVINANYQAWLQMAKEKEEPKEIKQTEEELLVDYVLELDMRLIMLEFGL